MAISSSINTIDWIEPASVRIIDQTLLPNKFEVLEVSNYLSMIDAIKNMLVRGAPAIGIAGAFAFVLASIELQKKVSDFKLFKTFLLEVGKEIKNARPTAVNLEWAVDTLIAALNNIDTDDISFIVESLKEKALAMHAEDIASCKAIGDYGATLVPKGASILTHCNAGGLATVSYGTALGVIRSAFSVDPTIKVYADETRPRLQGAKLTVWELLESGIDTTLVTDGMCAHLMSKGMIDLVVVGADRIASNGDTANKIGTFTVALVAKEYNVPFYIAAPLSTIDINIKDGSYIPIEERSEDEIKIVNGSYVTHKNVKVYNPAFDVTPSKYISAIITDKGILKAPFDKSISQVFSQASKDQRACSSTL